MTSYDEDDFLQISGIQHFAFCERQWALSYIEMQWLENDRTIEGKQLHNKAHDAFITEKRGDLLISRAMPIRSRVLGVSGECDIVEFHRDDEHGINLHGQDHLFTVSPVEYKRGSPKITDVDRLQLCTQAMCLEEMLNCEISLGYLYYGETRHREKVVLDDDLREQVKKLLILMHQYYERGFTPKVKWSKSCNACSLKGVCLPVIGKKENVNSYIDKKLLEDT